MQEIEIIENYIFGLYFSDMIHFETVLFLNELIIRPCFYFSFTNEDICILADLLEKYFFDEIKFDFEVNFSKSMNLFSIMNFCFDFPNSVILLKILDGKIVKTNVLFYLMELVKIPNLNLKSVFISTILLLKRNKLKSWNRWKIYRFYMILKRIELFIGREFTEICRLYSKIRKENL